MEKSIMEVQEEVEGFSRRRNQLEEKIHTLKNTLKEEERTHRKLEVEVKPMQDMIKELESQVPGQQIKVNKELEDKNRMLKENPGLLQLYKDLVITQIMKPDEFWEQHAPVNGVRTAAAGTAGGPNHQVCNST